MTSLWLHSAAQALAYLGCCSGIYVSATLLARSWRKRSNPTAAVVSTTPTSSSWSNSTYKGSLITAFRDTSTRTDAASLLLFLCALGLFASAMVNEMHHPDAISLRNVHILSRIDDYNFVADVTPADPTLPRIQFALSACQDFIPTHEIQPGITLTWLGYTEDRVHHCDELDGPDAGYALERDRYNAPIIHNWKADAFSGSPAAPQHASSAPSPTAYSTARP